MLWGLITYLNLDVIPLSITPHIIGRAYLNWILCDPQTPMSGKQNSEDVPEGCAFGFVGSFAFALLFSPS